jgi:hypothetical protein
MDSVSVSSSPDSGTRILATKIRDRVREKDTAV